MDQQGSMTPTEYNELQAKIEAEKQAQKELDAQQKLEKNPNRIWIITVCSLVVLVLGLGAGLIMSLVTSSENKTTIDGLQAEVTAKTEMLNRYKEATNTQTPEDVTIASTDEFDFKTIHQVLESKLASNERRYELNYKDAWIKFNKGGDYQIAKLGVTFFESADASQGLYKLGDGFSAYLYRPFPNGKWKYSNFSAQESPSCDEITVEEQQAFAGVLECEDIY